LVIKSNTVYFCDQHCVDRLAPFTDARMGWIGFTKTRACNVR
jgi:hypothetical protein